MEVQPRVAPSTMRCRQGSQRNVDEPPTPEWVRWQIKKQKLYRVGMGGDWEAAKKMFDADSSLKSVRLNGEGMTALHVAANCGRSDFVVKLVRILDIEELEEVDQLGRNVLHHVALASGVRSARAIVGKLPSLSQAKEAYGFTPLFYAARWRNSSENMDMLEYLYSITDDKVYLDQESAPSLIVAIAGSGCHHVALKILRRHRQLALATNLSGWSIIYVLASQPSAFLSGNRIPVWKKMLYPWMTIASQQPNNAIEIVHFICKELQKNRYSAMDYFLPTGDLPATLQVATRNGVFKLVELCLDYFPDLIWYTSERGRSLIHVAVKHRQIEVFNHIMELIGENAGAYAATKVAGDDNNVLHLAALLAPTLQLHSIPGPAFQMQRELEWFKAVEDLVYKEERDARNSEDKTPLQLFFEQHNDLLKDAKEWIKDTSNSCMVVAALVATVAFASMITVPGGNDSGTGKPVLSKKEVFLVFSVSNALSMISSAIALLMFLSLQTSRFTTDDFLATLPKNLVRGLLSLFFAVATMMIAFGTAIGMALQTRVNWVYIPITVVACIPAIIFTKLQLPLLFQTIGVTSGPVVFTKQWNHKKWRPKTFCSNSSLVDDI